MAEQKINQLVERIVRIFRRNDGLTGLFFRDLGQIHLYDHRTDRTETFTYDPSDIEDFFQRYEDAVERRAILEYQNKNK